MCNQKWEIQPTLIDFHPNDYIQELHYYPFAVKLDKFFGRSNCLNDLSNGVCDPNKTKDLNIHAFNMSTRKNDPKS